MKACTAAPLVVAKDWSSQSIPDYETSIGSASQSMVKELGKAIILTGSLVVGVLETISLTAYVALVAIATAFNSDFERVLNDGLKRLNFSINRISSIFSQEVEKVPTVVSSSKNPSAPESLKAWALTRNLVTLTIGWKIANYFITDWVLPVEKDLKNACQIEKIASSCALQQWHHIYLGAGVASIAAAYFLYVSRQKSSEEEQSCCENKKDNHSWNLGSLAKSMMLVYLCKSIVSSFFSFHDYLNSNQCVPIEKLGYTVLNPYDILDPSVFGLWSDAKVFSSSLIDTVVKSGSDFVNEYGPKLLDTAKSLNGSLILESCGNFIKTHQVGLLVLGYLSL